MIDTEKYEGHTPAPWYFWCGGVSTGPVSSGEDITKSEVNGKLIADAPLLLAEIKRLRKTLACIAFSPDDPKWVGEKLDELAVDSDTWKRWLE